MQISKTQQNDQVPAVDLDGPDFQPALIARNENHLLQLVSLLNTTITTDGKVEFTLIYH